MAVDLQKRDSLLLPYQFLTDENNILLKKSKPMRSICSTSSFGNSDFGSSMSSTLDSELDSTESESDPPDEDYIGELTRQMAHSMLLDDDIKPEQPWSMAASPSPQSALGSSQEGVPIFGNFEKLEIDEEMYKYDKKEIFLSTSLEPTSVPSTLRKPSGSMADFLSKQALIDEQIRAIQLCKLKQKQIMKQQDQCSLYWGKQANCYKQILSEQESRHFQTKGRAYGGHSNGQKAYSRANLHQEQQRTGSETRAVFLSDFGSRTGSCGTGVFLPRGISNSPHTRKKSGCSTVLVPARVVQALKLHFDKMGTESNSSTTARLFPFQHDSLMGDVRYDLIKLQQKSKSKTVPAMSYHQDTGLPQEWMY